MQTAKDGITNKPKEGSAMNNTQSQKRISELTDAVLGRLVAMGIDPQDSALAEKELQDNTVCPELCLMIYRKYIKII